MRFQIGEDHVDIDAGPADPALQRFAARLRLRAQLHKIDESRVGGDDAAFGVGDDESLRHGLDYAEPLRVLFRGRALSVLRA